MGNKPKTIVTKKELVIVATALNDFVDPPIDVRSLEVSELSKKIKEGVKLFIPEEDDLGEEAETILKNMGLIDSERKLIVMTEVAEEVAEEVEDKKKKVKEPKKPGVIATIAEVMKNSTEGVTKNEIHAALIEAFPERNPEAMFVTINAQIPTRMKKSGYNVVSIKNEGEPKKYKIEG